jgi:hypothetical protein
MHGMVAISAFIAHKPPVRNRELVTGQIIARNEALSFGRGSFFALVDYLLASSRLPGPSRSGIPVAAAV